MVEIVGKAPAAVAREYYAITEAAALLGVSRVTLWRWIAAGRLPVWRPGPHTARIRREDLERLLAGGTAHSGPEHFVQFYESDDVLADAVAEFIGTGLREGAAGVVIAMPEHRAAIERRLVAAGRDLAAARADGSYVPLDAAETLAAFMVDGTPDAVLFERTIRPVIDAAAGGRRKVNAFGEMVALLALAGNTAAAIQLEQLWNDLQATRSFSLLCAYPISKLRGPEFETLVGEVCDTHTRVVPAESYTRLTADPERLRLVAELQQKAATLEAEIAQRVRAEQELRDFVESAAIAMHWVARDGTILWANRAELEMLGYSAEEYVGRNIAELYADQPTLEDILARLEAGETLREYPSRLRAKDGSIKHVLIDSSVLWEDGRFVHTRCFTRDVTELRRLEEERQRLLDRERVARREAEEQAASHVALNGALREAAEDRDRALAAEREAAERTRRLQEITGQLSRSLEADQVLESIARSAAELLDAPVGAVFLLDPAQPGADFALAAAHGIDEAKAPELRLPRRASLAGQAVDQGRTLVVDDVRETPSTALPQLLTGQTAGSEIAAPIAVGGERLGVVKAFSPTVRRFSPDDADLLTSLADAAAVALTNARLYRQAQEAVHARDEFLATAAHDLKTPLTAIKATAQFLRRQAVKGVALTPERLIDGMTSLDAAATRAARQVDQLLDITRVRVGQQIELQVRPTDLLALANQVAAEHRPSTERHAIRVEAEAAELVGTWDRGRLERVLDNLIGNAIKYSPAGGDVVVSLGRESDAAGDWAVVAVRDHGIGIPSGDLERVFDRFSRGSNVPEPIGGSGIGLTSVRQIVERHGGTVAVESREGEGSTFTVRLPLGGTLAAQA